MSAEKVLRFLERSVLAPRRTLVRLVRTEDVSAVTTVEANPKQLHELAGDVYDVAREDAKAYKTRRIYRVEVGPKKGPAECSIVLPFGEDAAPATTTALASTSATSAELVAELRHIVREANQALVLNTAAIGQREKELQAHTAKELKRMTDYCVMVEGLRNRDLNAAIEQWKTTQELLDRQNERDLEKIKFIASQENWANGLKTFFGIANGVAQRWLLAGGGKVTQRELVIAKVFNAISEDPARLTKMLEAAGTDEAELHAAIDAIFTRLKEENKDDGDGGEKPTTH